VETPLAVWSVERPEENVPHVLFSAGVHVTAQSTPPPLAGSLVTVALSVALPPTGSEVGIPLIEEMVMTGALMVITAVTNAAGFAVELAVMETESPPVGTVAGAVYTMAAPLAVWAGLPGLNVPQPFAPFEQLTVQSTPRFKGSLDTIATMLAVALVTNVLGGAPAPTANAMEREAVGVTVRFVVTVWVGSATEVAVIVTLRLDVTMAGAVYVAGAPLAVCCVIIPQPEDGQISVQLTPKLFGSPVTFAVTCVELPAAKGEAGNPVNVTETELKMPTVTVMLSEGEAVAFALRFTLFGGTEVGAVYTVATPLAVCVGLNEPQFTALQLATQSTPSFEASFATLTMREICDPDCRAAGGDCENETVISLALGGRTSFVMQADSSPRLRIKTRSSKAERRVAKTSELRVALKPFWLLITPPQK
jgi:hypothetical protein